MQGNASPKVFQFKHFRLSCECAIFLHLLLTSGKHTQRQQFIGKPQKKWAVFEVNVDSQKLLFFFFSWWKFMYILIQFYPLEKIKLDNQSELQARPCWGTHFFLLGMVPFFSSSPLGPTRIASHEPPTPRNSVSLMWNMSPTLNEWSPDSELGW